MTSTDHNTDLIDVITDDHRAVESLLQEVETTTTSPEHRRQLADHVITELVRQVVIEQEYLHPVVRERLPDGEGIAERGHARHTELEQAMAELENLSPADPRFELLLSTLTADVRKHNQDVQSSLPALEKACSAAERRELGEQVLRAKQLAPTRPHPANPDRLPDGPVLDPGVPLIESVRSALSGRDR